MIALLAGAALAGSVGFERVDVLSEDPGLWLRDSTPWAPAVSTTGSAVRFATQVKVVWFLPVEGLTVGTSVQSQSLHLERPVWRSVSVGGGVQTALGLPRGALAGVAVRHGKLRVGLSLNALSGATWARPEWTSWRVLPGVGVGVGRARAEREVWMDARP